MTVAVLPPPMLQRESEFGELLELYRRRRPGRVLEVGVGEGGTLYHWLNAAPAGATVVAIDDRHEARDRYHDWTPKGVALATIVGDSADHFTIARAALHGPYDWMFIDADHHDLAVRADWLNYRQLAAPGAVVALHDIRPLGDPTIQVDRLWAELRERHETVEIDHGGHGIGVVYMPPKPGEAS